MPRLSLLPVVALLAACVGGTVAGSAAVGGMAPLYRGAEPPVLGAEREALAWAQEEAAAPAEPVWLAALPAAEPSPPCVECSDYDVGYRWAETHTPADARRCADDASAFADGCAAWLADRRSGEPPAV